jgi:hypothetical protein
VVPSRVAPLLVAVVTGAFVLTPGAWAPDRAANVGVAASFDRRAIAPGQVAVATVQITNRGPNPARGATVAAQVEGARILHARTLPGRCRVVGERSARCSFPPLGFGSFPGVTLELRPATGTRRVAVDAQAATRVTRDPVARDNRSTAALPVNRAVPASFAEISFVFTAPTNAVAGRPFTAVLTLLNRGPASPAIVEPVQITPIPAARVRLPPLPPALRVGEHRDVRLQITPTRPGRLAIRVAVGATGRATAFVSVR